MPKVITVEGTDQVLVENDVGWVSHVCKKEQVCYSPTQNDLVPNRRVETTIPWPKKRVGPTFQGHRFELVPEVGEAEKRIAVEHEGDDFDGDKLLVTRLQIRRLMSSMAWATGGFIDDANVIGASTIVSMSTSHSKHGYIPQPDHLPGVPKDLPEPRTPEQKLALALYREALGLSNNISFQFLSFYKVVNIVASSGSEQTSQLKLWLQKVSERRYCWWAGFIAQWLDDFDEGPDEAARIKKTRRTPSPSPPFSPRPWARVRVAALRRLPL